MDYFDFGVNLAFLLMIVSTFVSIAYGIVNWNRDAYEKPPSHVKEWNSVEKHIEEDL